MKGQITAKTGKDKMKIVMVLAHLSRDVGRSHDGVRRLSIPATPIAIQMIATDNPPITHTIKNVRMVKAA